MDSGDADSSRPPEMAINVAVRTVAWRRPGLAALVRRAAAAALEDNRWRAQGIEFGNSELAVELASNERVAALNARYRGRSEPTNVLSFPAFEADEMAAAFAAPRLRPLWLGDLVVADGVAMAEAAAAGRPLEHHLAHLIVHGTLHCLGYDHVEEDAAADMEALERRILARLSIPDPYREGGDERVPA